MVAPGVPLGALQLGKQSPQSTSEHILVSYDMPLASAWGLLALVEL